ncbi:MAG: Fic family protein [Phycisphaerales bacterium]
MIWNWQQPDWPEFTWNRPRFENAERAFLVGGGVIVGAVGHLDPDSENALLVEIYTCEAMKTSEIEGELLDRDSVQSSIRRQLGLASDPAKVRAAEEGIATLMVDLDRHAAEPLTHETLFAWHRMLTQGRRDLRDVGRYRTHAEPMQVISGPLHRPTVHFEAPPSARMPEEMERFIDWFNRTAPGGGEPMPAITRAGIAHLYFVSIHPFEDGNGRIGRAIAEKALAQGLGSPTLTALADTIMLRRPEYYHELELANKRNEMTPWLAWFAGITLEAQRRTQARVDFTLDKARLLDRLRVQLNQRQEKALLRMFREGPDGFKGGLSAGNYHSITDATPATATRDLADLVEKGALTRTGEKKHTRYHLAIPLRPVPRVTIADDGEVQG